MAAEKGAPRGLGVLSSKSEDGSRSALASFVDQQARGEQKSRHDVAVRGAGDASGASTGHPRGPHRLRT